MNLEVIMCENKGPVFPNPLKDPSDLNRLKIPEIEELSYVFDAVFLTRMALDGRAALIGFCGAPWTLFCYMIEGGGTKLFSKAKKWIYKY